ncbi:hypothetical protein [Nocardia suismassiliense]|uniref:hypothetical protein n=1 Tax=Nocardia suismassiliense TaxID=2077092 RepID=UPI0018FEDFC6|nr:hypothetical protein [Nocardia suismassiliense]
MTGVDWARAPVYLSPPTAVTHPHLRTGMLGAIVTPASGNRITSDYQFWAADNGVFTGRYPGDTAYLRWLERRTPHADRCLFATAPDVVGDHLSTLARSRGMLARIRDLGFPAAFVAQNGMEYEASSDLWEEFDVLFLGGDTAWKLGPAAAELTRCARDDFAKWVHMGRVNSAIRYEHARATGCHSVDGTTITRAPAENLSKVLQWTRTALAQPTLLDIPHTWVPPHTHHHTSRPAASTIARASSSEQATFDFDPDPRSPVADISIYELLSATAPSIHPCPTQRAHTMGRDVPETDDLAVTFTPVTSAAEP